MDNVPVYAVQFYLVSEFALTYPLYAPELVLGGLDSPSLEGGLELLLLFLLRRFSSSAILAACWATSLCNAAIFSIKL
jgi:hypothetical protein